MEKVTYRAIEPLLTPYLPLTKDFYLLARLTKNSTTAPLVTQQANDAHHPPLVTSRTQPVTSKRSGSWALLYGVLQEKRFVEKLSAHFEALRKS